MKLCHQGLVPITNKVAAVTEFVDNTCGILVGEEDSIGIANAIKKLYYDEELFLKFSENAAKRVRKQSPYEKTILKEVELINNINHDS